MRGTSLPLTLTCCCVLALVALVAPVSAAEAPTDTAQEAPAATVTATDAAPALAPGEAGARVFIDPATGERRLPNAAEKQVMARQLRSMLSRSTEGLVPVYRGDGTVVLDLEGRFMSVAVARKQADGTVEHECVTDEAAAGAFLAGTAPVSQPQEVRDDR